MKNYKIQDREREAVPSLPSYRKLMLVESRNAIARLITALSLPRMSAADQMCFSSAIDERLTSRFVNDDDLPDLTFDQVFTRCGISPAPSLYVIWSFREVDEFSTTDLNNYFLDIWYPGPDGFVIFDQGCEWAILVNHDCDIGALKL